MHLVTAASKIFELCLSVILEDYLFTHDQQFGFKSKHSTDFCIFTVKSVSKYYTQQLHSTSYTCFLDASKAFDKINHFKLFRKLLDRNNQYYSCSRSELARIKLPLDAMHCKNEHCIKHRHDIDSFYYSIINALDATMK